MQHLESSYQVQQNVLCQFQNKESIRGKLKEVRDYSEGRNTLTHAARSN
jgi:hypothetical protein